MNGDLWHLVPTSGLKNICPECLTSNHETRPINRPIPRFLFLGIKVQGVPTSGLLNVCPQFLTSDPESRPKNKTISRFEFFGAIYDSATFYMGGELFAWDVPMSGLRNVCPQNLTTDPETRPKNRPILSFSCFGKNWLGHFLHGREALVPWEVPTSGRISVCPQFLASDPETRSKNRLIQRFYFCCGQILTRTLCTWALFIWCVPTSGLKTFARNFWLRILQIGPKIGRVRY